MLLLKTEDGQVLARLDSERIAIGRHQANDIVLDDASVSSFHAVILKDRDTVSVVDLGSTEGTAIDGLRLRERTELKVWRSLRLGTVELRVEDTESRAPTRVRPLTAGTELRTQVSSAGDAETTALPSLAEIRFESLGGAASASGVAALDRERHERTRSGSSGPDYHPNYRVLEQLHGDARSELFRARDERRGREVVLRVLDAAFARDLAWMKRFEELIRASATLSHPNITPVYEYGYAAGRPFYTRAVEVCGDTADWPYLRHSITVLKSMIRGQVGRLRSAEDVVWGVALALAHAHDRGFVHDAVKPGNIFVECASRYEETTVKVRLTDFGIAWEMNRISSFTHHPYEFVDVNYVSPERALGGGVDGRSDLYSLGAVLFEMLTGKPPYAPKDPGRAGAYDRGLALSLEVAHKHINDPVPRLPAALAKYQALLDGLMAKSPDDRYATGVEVAAACEGLFDGLCIPRRNKGWLVWS